MANRPFTIQDNAISLNGVEIQAAVDGKVVIPGITASAGYVVEEVEDTGDQTQTWTAPTVIDHAYFSSLSGAYSGAGYTNAAYIVELDGDGYIDEITVDVAGVLPATDTVWLNVDYMWATDVATPFVSFNAGDWTQIPFKTVLRAISIEADPTSPIGGALTVSDGVQPPVENVTEIIVENSVVTEIEPGVVTVNVSGGSDAKTFLHTTQERLINRSNPGFEDFDNLTGGSAPPFLTDNGDSTFVYDSNGLGITGDASDIGYPVFTDFTIPSDTNVMVEFTFVWNDACADHGVCVFKDGDEPSWAWDTEPSRIAGQWNCGNPELYGPTFQSKMTPDQGENNWLVSGNEYTARFIYSPATSTTTLETFTLSGALLDKRYINERLSAGAYRVGFSADQDDGNVPGEVPTSYFKDLRIVTDFKEVMLRDDGLLQFPDGTRIGQTEGAGTFGLYNPNSNTEFIIDAAGNYWSFNGSTADLQLPAGGDIVDSNGNSVLGGGVPTIPNTIQGFINLVGDRPNDGDDAWFESVVVRGNYAYVLGGDYYINGSNNLSKIYKFDLRTGGQIWVKQIFAGRGATFDVSIAAGVITLDLISAAGNGYIAGEELVFPGWAIGGNQPLNNFIITVDTVNVNGSIQTASIKPGYDAAGLSGTYTSLTPDNDNAQGDPACISYDDYNDKVIVVSRYRSGLGDVDIDSWWTWANVYVIDPSTGAVNQTVTMSDSGDILPHSIATYNKAAGAAVVGMKYDEYREFGTLTILQGGTGFFDILLSNLDPEHYPDADVYNPSSDFWIMGTGINTMNNVDGVNVFTGLTGTTREGSGAEFTITDNGDTTYTLTAITNGGTNYLVGHKIKILGTSLGGTTPANDAIVEVTTAASGVITAATVSGAAAGGISTPYTGLSGTNYNVGSGFSLDMTLATGSNIYDDSVILNSVNGGLDYVAGDIITIAGNNFANGTSPTHNLVVLVGTVNGSGYITSLTFSGTRQNNAIRLVVNTVDFTVGGGSWSMKQNLQGEAFIWTPGWSNAIGGPSGDRFYDVCWSGDGNYLYAVGAGIYEVPYTQALVVKFNASTGAVVWSKDIKFTEAGTENREARAVIEIPNSTDIMVAGAWYNNGPGQDEIILTRITAAGVAVWQKTYRLTNGSDIGFELNLKATNDSVIVSLENSTPTDNRGLAYLQIDPTDGTVIRHRVLSADGNSNYNYFNTPTSNFADIYTDADGDYIVMSGYTYVPTDNYYNALLFRLPIGDIFNIAVNERWSLGEHILNNFAWTVTTVTSAFDSFTPIEHISTITNTADAKGYTTETPLGILENFTFTVTDDSTGYLEFGDGSKQSFATDKVPQIPAANDYYLTTQDSGKHIFFEHETGAVYIPHRDDRTFPVGFTFTIVNTTGGNCFLQTMTGSTDRARLKLAGRNIDTINVGIPDSGSGSMITVMKIKDGYLMENSDGLGDYPDVWIVSGPGDLYDNDV